MVYPLRFRNVPRTFRSLLFPLFPVVNHVADAEQRPYAPSLRDGTALRMGRVAVVYLRYRAYAVAADILLEGGEQLFCFPYESCSAQVESRLDIVFERPYPYRSLMVGRVARGLVASGIL